MAGELAGWKVEEFSQIVPGKGQEIWKSERSKKTWKSRCTDIWLLRSVKEKIEKKNYLKNINLWDTHTHTHTALDPWCERHQRPRENFKDFQMTYKRTRIRFTSDFLRGTNTGCKKITEYYF